MSDLNNNIEAKYYYDLFASGFLYALQHRRKTEEKFNKVKIFTQLTLKNLIEP